MKTINRIKYNTISNCILTAILFLLLGNFLAAQDFKGYVLAKGSARFDKRPIKDAVINLYSGGTKVQTKKGSTAGKFEFKLDFGKTYEIEVTAAELVSKKININTKVPAEELEDIIPYKFALELFEMIPGLDVSALSAPVSKISFGELKREFVFDPEYTKQMKKTLDIIEKQLKTLKTKRYSETISKADGFFKEGKYEEAMQYYDLAIDYDPYQTYPDDMLYECEEKLRESNNEEAGYNRYITNGDRSFKAGSYATAKSAYEKALKIKSDEAYPADQIKKIEEIWDNEEKEENIENEYNTLITKADGYYANKKYPEARNTYVKASEIKTDEEYPKDKISQIDKLLINLEKNAAESKAKEEAYTKKIAEADASLKSKDYSAAKVSYTAALEIKPDEQYPKGKIKEVDKLLADQAKAEANSQAKEESYQKAITAADASLKAKDYAAAKASYSSASGIKPEERYPKDKITEIDKLLADQAKADAEAQELEASYQKAITTADASLKGKQYDEAKNSYNEALKLKPNEQYPKDKIEEIDKTLADLAKAEANTKAQDDAYQKAVNEGDASLKAKDYQAAKASYSSASGIKPEEKYPKDKIEEIDKLLADQAKADAEAQELEASYQKAITTADASLKGKQYDEAKNSYNEALKLKPNEQYPKDKIEEIDKTIADLAKAEANAKAQDDAYQKAVTEGDASLKAKDYTAAKTSYSSASGIKPDEQYPKDKITEIDKILADQAKAEADMQAKETAYQKAVTAGDASLKAKDYTAAKASYSSASGIKPNEQYPKDKITEIDKILADQAKAEADMQAKETAYQKAITNGDASFKAKDYAAAKASYKSASGIKPDEKYPKDKIEEIDKLMADQAKADAEAQELEASYQKAITTADASLKGKQYDDAKSSYNEAIKLKPNEQYPKDKIAEIDKTLADLAKAEANAKAQDVAYQKAVTEGDASLKAKDYTAAKTSYSSASGIKPNEQYPKDKIAEIDKILADQAKAEADMQAKETAYQKAITTGDASLKAKDYAAAKASYKSASGIKPDEKYPKDKIAEIDKLLADQAKADAEAQELEASYQKAITTADASLKGKQYDDAKSSYNEAIKLKPNEQYPKDKIAEIDKTLADHAKAEANAKAQDDAYQKAVTAGDAALKAKDYEAAKASYSSASGIKPNEQYPKDKITEIDKILADQAKAEADMQAKETAYQKAVTTGDASFKAKDYAAAKASYSSASGIKPDEKYPKDKITEIDKLLADQAKADAEAQELEASYQKAITTADASLKGKQYDAAKKAYNDALKLKPNEQYPKDKIAEIDKTIADLAKAEANAKAQDDAYQKAVTAGDAALKAKDYAAAKASYSSASGIKPDEQYPKDKITEIDKVLADQAKAEADMQAKETAYQKAITAGDASLKAKDFTAAKASYTSASGIKPDEKYPKDKIAEIDKLLADQAKADAEAQELEASYQKAITTADASLKGKQYDAAKSSYNEAIKLKPNEQYPKDKIAEIDKTLADLAKAEADAKALDESYQKAIAAADALLLEKKFTDAKSSYTTASGIKPAESYPKQKIAEIDKILAEQAKADAEAKASQKEALYNKSISKADGLYKAKQYDQALAEFKKALNIKPGEAYPTNMVKEINALIKKLESAEEEYNIALTQAFNLFKTKDYSEARKIYIKASELKPDESFPKSKISEIDDILAKQQQKSDSDQKKELAYQNAIKQADAAYDKKEYTSALDLYKKALTFKPYADYPKQRIKAINSTIKAEEEAEAAKQYKEINFEDKVEKEKYLNELAQKYPEGVTTENYKQPGKTITLVIVNKSGIATEYKKVQTGYGVFYFKNGKSISGSLFAKETKE